MGTRQRVFGTMDNIPMSVHDDSHVFVAARTRGGKGTSVLIPNIILWPGSILVNDPKGENAIVTARQRGKGSAFSTGYGQQVYILDPFDEVKTDRDSFSDLKASFNPIDIVLQSSEPQADAARIAQALIVPRNSNDPYWEDAARTLLKALILYVAGSINFLPHERTLITVRKLATEGEDNSGSHSDHETETPSSPFETLARSMKRTIAFDGEVSLAGAMFENLLLSEKTATGVLQMLYTNLDFMSSPAVRACLSHSTFKLSDLKTSQKGISVYLCLPNRDADTCAGWLRMMIGLTLSEMEKTRGGASFWTSSSNGAG